MNLESEINSELWLAVRRSYESEAWSNAILDAIHFIGDSIRRKTGLESDGIALISQAFGGKSPKLLVNKMQTESEKNVQAGTEQLLRGLYQAVRNPRSHERISDTQDNANSLIIFINYILNIIGHAKNIFSLDEFVGKVIEEGFVPNKRYASLLISEIPSKSKLPVAISVYRQKNTSNSKNLKFFFDVILHELSESETTELFEEISDDLRTNNNNDNLRCVLQLLDPSNWSSLSEAARLRSEYKIISSIEDGSYNKNTKRCTAGGLATWSCSFWPLFSLKNELMTSVIRKLRSSSASSKNYVYEYLFRYLDFLFDAPPTSLIAFIKQKLKEGDQELFDAVNDSYLWSNTLWPDTVIEALSEFKPSQATNFDLDDELPF
ncbi:TIGR02391 family protein [Pseudomonas chlororaphis]|uniref:TIGR02391 family protein n=1 Tax=Pseudomonas chlororaphis TaxID=587753 RepID=UPI0009B856C4|nr:TIGR02391 family protein [Pseudomonas chlororaphis]